MREILFRGKRVDNGEWVYGFYQSFRHYIGMKYEVVHAILIEAITIKVDPETVGQFTGITDKEGTKIFEGDFVKSSDNGGDFEVKFGECNEGYIGWYVLSDGGFQWPLGSDSWTNRNSNIKVIGNIHQ